MHAHTHAFMTIAAITTLAASTPGMAQAQLPHTASSPSARSGDPRIQELIDAYPGLTETDLIASLGLKDASAEARNKALDRTVAETRRAQKAAQESRRESAMQPRSSSSSGGGSDVYLGGSRNQGDIFWSPSNTQPYNHIGLYYTTDTIAEAPGLTSVTRKSSAKNALVAKGTQKKLVYGATATQRLRAANWAGKHLNRPYNVAFFNNRIVESSVYNCSQFVWASYITAFDLDSNGGSAVMPDDIRNSPDTRWYQTL